MVLFMDWGYFVHQSTQKKEREREGETVREREGGESLLQAI